MTGDALEHLAELLRDAADYALATGEAATARVLVRAAATARALAARERAAAQVA